MHELKGEMRLRCSASKCDHCFITPGPRGHTAQRGRDGAKHSHR